MNGERFTYEVNIYSRCPVEESSPAFFDRLLNALNEYVETGAGTKFTTTISPFEPALDVILRISADATAMIGQYAPFTYLVAIPRGNFQGARILFYFVRKCRWVGNKSLELTLHMDVIHTLLRTNNQLDALSSCLTAKTMILREHEPRWAFVTTKNNTRYFLPHVDNVSEGLGIAPLWKQLDTPIYDKRFAGHAVVNESWQVTFFKATTDKESYSSVGINATGTSVPFTATIDDVTISGELATAQSLNTLSESVSKAIIFPYFPYGKITKSGDFFVWSQKDVNVAPLTNEKIFRGLSLVADITNKLTYPTGSNFENNPFASVDMLAKETQALAVNSVSATTRRCLKDSKLFKSDFYKHSFIYGDYEFSPQYERYDWNDSNIHSYDIYIFADMVPVSSFSFKFIPQKGSNGKECFTYRGDTPFDEIINVAQNNERALFTDSYLNYLKNGYNYELIKQGTSLATTGLTSIGGIVAATAVAGIGGTIAAGAAALINIATNTINSETALAEKQSQLRAQSLKASGVSTYGAFRATKGDKMHECVFKISDSLTKTLDDMFYYYGYKRGYQGVPNARTRYWFNFVQCNPKFKSGYLGTWSYLQDELTKLFQSGITFYHRHKNAIGEFGYDQNQEMENWENDIINS